MVVFRESEGRGGGSKPYFSTPGLKASSGTVFVKLTPINIPGPTLRPRKPFETESLFPGCRVRDRVRREKVRRNTYSPRSFSVRRSLGHQTPERGTGCGVEQGRANENGTGKVRSLGSRNGLPNRLGGQPAPSVPSSPPRESDPPSPSPSPSQSPPRPLRSTLSGSGLISRSFGRPLSRADEHTGRVSPLIL